MRIYWVLGYDQYYPSAGLGNVKATFATYDEAADFVREKQIQAQNVEALEKRITEIVAMGAGDRVTAIRWIRDAEGCHGDDDYLCYLLDIPYGFFSKEVK